MAAYEEIQSDPKWAVTLKSLFEKMPPLCFTEYEMIKNGVYPPKLKEKIRQAVYFSADAEDVYHNLLPLQAGVHQYWSKVNRADIKAYLAYGSNMTIAKKPNKYLFISPAIRMSFFYFTGQESTYLTRQGKLLEDSIGSHLYREFIIWGQGAIRYDSEQGGADFVLQILNKKQIINSMKKSIPTTI